ncbi:MAG: DUF1761 domain-containing protein [Pseudolabrys sp.]
MNFTHANLVSILIAAVAAWIFGGVYYTALSKPWMAAQGKNVEQCKAELDAKSGTAKGAPFVVVFISEIIIAWVLYGILLHMNMFSVRAGIISAAFCWFGFALTTIATNNAFQARRVMLTVIDSIAWLGAFLIIGAIVGGRGP